uniref:Transmembrane protein 239 n=1 Tax=Equus caballus TaxID=9796 RepID=A0A9L0TN03_HORSE
MTHLYLPGPEALAYPIPVHPRGLGAGQGSGSPVGPCVSPWGPSLAQLLDNVLGLAALGLTTLAVSSTAGPALLLLLLLVSFLAFDLLHRCTRHDAAAANGDRCHWGWRGAAAGSALVGLGHTAGLGALVHVPRAPELDPVVDHIGLAATTAAHAVGSGGDPLPAAGPDAVPCTLHYWLPPAGLLVACRGRSVAPSAASCPPAGAQCPPCPALHRLLPAAVLHAAEPRGPSHLHVSLRLRSGLGPIEGQPHPAACVC